MLLREMERVLRRVSGGDGDGGGGGDGDGDGDECWEVEISAARRKRTEETEGRKKTMRWE